VTLKGTSARVSPHIPHCLPYQPTALTLACLLRTQALGGLTSWPTVTCGYRCTFESTKFSTAVVTGRHAFDACGCPLSDGRACIVLGGPKANSGVVATLPTSVWLLSCLPTRHMVLDAITGRFATYHRRNSNLGGGRHCSACQPALVAALEWYAVLQHRATDTYSTFTSPWRGWGFNLLCKMA
jgi:hypothetical protein